MPPRLNKRQQRELEELQALGGPSAADVSSEEELPASKIAVSTFSNFLVSEDIETESENEGSVIPAKSRKKKKKKKATTAETLKPPATTKSFQDSAPATPPVAKNEKKALKKAKAKEKKAGNDELENALAELSMKYPELQKTAKPTLSPQSLATLLAVSLTHLDSEAEMRKFFGSKVVQANKSGPSRSSGSSRRNATLQRSNLTRPQPSWWSASQREGLSIRNLTEEELKAKEKRHGWGSLDEKWWTVEYSQRYKSMTKSFIKAVMSGHPEALFDLQQKLPWHADNLLQLAEIYRHREEYAQAVDFVDRAIFTYERAFIGAFNFTSGNNRLDFDSVENRPFFLAIHRQIADLQRRGCVRTAFEFARLLYSLDPWNDPHGALYHLDLLALKAGMGQWLLDVYDHFAKRREQQTEKADTRMDPSVLPGFMFSRALALKMAEDAKSIQDHLESTAALKDAIASFPSVVPLLADKIDVTLPAALRAHRDFKIETDASSLSSHISALHLLSHMYAQHSFGTWKEADNSAWFAATVASTFASLPSSLPSTPSRQAFLSLFKSNTSLQYSIYRHVTVLETTHRRLFSFIPRQILQDAKSLACDPLPPPTAVSRYDDEYFSGTEELVTLRARTRQERAMDDRALAQMIPDPAVRAQMEALFQLPEFAEHFPGGLVDAAQRMGPEALEDLLLAVVAGAGMMEGGEMGGEMPGQMPGFEGLMRDDVPEGEAEGHAAAVVDDRGQGVEEREDGSGDSGVDVQEDEDGDEEEAVSGVPRILRNIFGRIWGRPAPPEESSDEEELVDNAGVD
ncbi:Transcription factor 25 [Hypsizygus marmoreus]|uniref:Transcription factor 25 n=1 Tax=Hypsizygus marmoreus TaxID=39966 RepID=A0A369JDT5_HYPMA|nr:Transcription factor 25 [Hypsizygus marmoreus]